MYDLAHQSSNSYFSLTVLLRRYSYQIIVMSLFALACLPYWPFVVDDAYISFVYARNLSQGQGLTYNGLYVEGFSNFLWTLLIAVFLRLGIEPMLIARGLSLVFGAFCLLVIQKIQARLNPGLGKVIALFATLSAGLSALFLVWTVGGLETVFFASLITLNVYAELAGGYSTRYLSPLLVLAVALTRPEGNMLFPIFLAYRWLQRHRSASSWLSFTLLFLVPFSLFILWRYSTYGYPMPNTAYLKLDPNLDTTRLAAEWLLDYLWLRPIFAVLLMAGIIIVGRQWASVDPAWLLISAIILAFVSFVLFSGSDWMPHHRFLVPIIPLFGLYIGRLIASAREKRVRLVLQALTLIGILFEAGLSLSLYRPLTLDFGRYTNGLIQAGKWIKETTSPEDTIAVVDAGAIAYYSERPTIDILGLNNEHIAHTLEKSDPAYVLLHEPMIIQLHAGFSQTGELIEPVEQSAAREIISHPGFQECFRPDPDRPPDPYYPYLFLRGCP